MISNNIKLISHELNCFCNETKVRQTIAEAEASLAFLLLHWFGSCLGWKQQSVNVRGWNQC